MTGGKQGARGLRAGRAWAAALALGLAPVAGAQAPPTDAAVTIAGGADATGQNYGWQITNHGTSPIVWIEFPHYHADQFVAPDRWKKETTHLNIAGSRDEPGVCRASVEDPAYGIAPNRSASFSMRVSNAGASRRPGAVRLRFADGREVTVADVELPSPLSQGEQYQMLIGLAVILALVIVFQARRRRKAPATGPPA